MNRMTTIDENDPRLTAYALGEMPADEAAEFEKQVQGDAAIGAAVEEIRLTARMLQAEFAAEPSPGLSDAHHRAMERRMLHGDSDDAPQPIPITRGRWISRLLLGGAGLAAAACLAIAFILPMNQGRNNENFAVNQDSRSRNEFDSRLDENKQIAAGETVGKVIEDSKRGRELMTKSASTPPTEGRETGDRDQARWETLHVPPTATTLGRELQPIPGPATESAPTGGLGASNGPPQDQAASGTKKDEGPGLPDSTIVGVGERKAGVAEKEKSELGQPSVDRQAAQVKEESSPQSAGGKALFEPPSPSSSSPSPDSRTAEGAVSQDPRRVLDGQGLGGLSDATSEGHAITVGGDSGNADDQTFNQGFYLYDSADEQGDAPVNIEDLTRTIEPAAPPAAQPGRDSIDGSRAGESGARGLGGRGGSGGGAARPAKPSSAPVPSGGYAATDASLAELRRRIDALSLDQARNALAQVVNSLQHVFDLDEANRLRLCHRVLLERVRALGPNAEQFKVIRDNPFVRPIGQAALSTFGADVDTASYSNIRRFIQQQGQLPPRDAVRIEEMVNYFTYAYEPPSQDRPDAPPFSTNVEINAAPWNPSHRLVRIGLKGKEIPQDMRPPTSLVFLIDVSGSMQPANKLPLVKQSLHLLLDRLNGDDMLGIVTYAGNAGMPLDSTYVNDESKAKIRQIIDGMSAGGSTNGAGGLVMAYDLATRHFIKGGVNRVILCTDGDFNVGVSGDGELVRLIERQRESKVFLSVMGFGTGNLKDGKMEQLANHGNGEFAYIDGIDEARKVFVDQMAGTLVPIAKDVKFQVEFNPTKVAAYRQIGYENRKLAAQDFNNDRKDAGEIGAGHTVTVLYEVVPHGVSYEVPGAVDELKYQQPAPKPEPPVTEPALPASDELLTVKLRYKEPDGDVSKLLEIPVKDQGSGLEKASPDFLFASAVASFGMILRESPYRGAAHFQNVLWWAIEGQGEDPKGYRADFIRLVERAQALAPLPTPLPPPDDVIPMRR